MRIQLYSDLHIDVYRRKFGAGHTYIPPVSQQADVLVIAGDIHCGTQAVRDFRDAQIPVVYVAGNHEHYAPAPDMQDNLAHLREEAARTGGVVHFLENDEVIISGTRFLGTTLWTDYCVDGIDNQVGSMIDCGRYLVDHQEITYDGKTFMPGDALTLHARARDWLAAKLAEPFDGKTVVVTHHAPHPESIHPKYLGEAINGGFASDLTPLMGKSALWLHGHTHSSFDYKVNGTRVVANPRGYPGRHSQPTDAVFENREFNGSLLLEI